MGRIAGLTSSAVLPVGRVLAAPPAMPDDLFLIGPTKGYTPAVGTLVSMLDCMRFFVVSNVTGLSQTELDWQLDDKSNSIGAMLLHLAATERYYQLNTFDEVAWGDWSEEIKAKWDVPMALGEEARKQIKGHSVHYYLEQLEAVRKVTKIELARRDDDWLAKTTTFFAQKSTTNYAKWFHVAEHESNHNGQIKLIKRRLPAVAE
ncbi:MAG: DinB family protein [Myxococcota bacterium]